MLNYQKLLPTDDYLTVIEDANVYFIYDHLRPIDDVQDSLIYSLNQKNINKQDKYFIIDSYQYIENYDNQSILTSDFLMFMQWQYNNEFSSYSIDFSNKTKSFNCQLNKSRYSRLLASCWLANHLQGHVDFIYSQPWNTVTDFEYFLNANNEKFNFNLTAKILPANWFEYNNNPAEDYLTDTTNAQVFGNCLKAQMFDPTIFSIVIEPVGNELGCSITEKYINALYGGNIPIVYGYKAYDTLAKLGFDTFADIIDISSQDIVDPYQRIVHMLETNKAVLLNPITLNNSIMDRLTANLNHLRNSDVFFDKILHLNSKAMLLEYKTRLDADPTLIPLNPQFNPLFQSYDLTTL